MHMGSHLFTLRGPATSLALSTLFTLNAQVFIPDVNVRVLMNNTIPGIVDEDGYMDTEHPGIPSVTSLYWTPSIPATTVDFTGIEYLQAVETLYVSIDHQISTQDWIFQALPSGLHRLDLYLGGACSLPALPNSLEILSMSKSHSSQTVPHVNIDEMPDLLDALFMEPFPIQWNGTCHANVFHLNDMNGVQSMITSFHSPNIQCNESFINFFNIDTLDLSAIITEYLIIENMNINSYLSWPSNTQFIHLDFVNLYAEVPSWPTSITDLELIFSDLGGCFPPFPDDLSFLEIYGTDYDCLPNWPSALEAVFTGVGSPLGMDEVTFCSVLNSECPGPYPGVAGRVFVDENTNGLYDSGEPGLQQSTVVLQPSGHSVGVNAQGEWQFGIPPGNYTITAASTYPYVGSINPTNHTADVPNMGDTDVGNDFAATVIPGIEDLRAFINAEVTRPGFENRLFLACNNYGTEPVDAILTLDFDNDQSWVGSSVAPTSLTGNIATWDLGTLAMGTTVDLTVDLYTDPAVPLGTPIQHTLTSNPVAGDETPADNIALWTDSVIGSYDPNDKLISPATLTAAQVAAGVSPINYTIRFQNTGTYLAERVVILDTLPEGLVLESIQFLASSHDNHWYVTDGVLHVIHNDIMLPDSTSDEPNSHGYVMFRILPSTDLVEGQQILNIAHIVFDFNEPIITPPAVFTVQTPTNVDDHAVLGTMVYPNPVRDLLWISDNSGADTPYQIRDVHGRRVQQGTFTRRRPTAVHALEPGVYVIELLATDGVRSLRFVKE